MSAVCHRPVGWLLCLVVVASGAPTHLVVLQHGLYGNPCNLQEMQQQLHALGGGQVLAHLATSNEGRTRDGVAAGGRRLADEIRVLVNANPSLRTISLVGNSLGGLYVRAAATELLEQAAGKGGGLMANLEPRVLVTTACPHLGVRRYTYLPLPEFLTPAGRLVAGRTADELLLRDKAAGGGGGGGGGETGGGGEAVPLLVAMSQPQSPHVLALRRFTRRRLYANLRGDFMVPFGTAAIEGAGWAAGVGDATRAKYFYEGAPDLSFIDQSVCTGAADGVAVVRECAAEGGSGDQAGSAEMEELMRRGLSSVGWSKVAVAFRGATTLTPLAHNKLPALRRPGWRRAFEWVEQAHEGRVVVEHAVRYILDGLD